MDTSALLPSIAAKLAALGLSDLAAVRAYVTKPVAAETLGRVHLVEVAAWLQEQPK